MMARWVSCVAVRPGSRTEIASGTCMGEVKRTRGKKLPLAAAGAWDGARKTPQH